MALLPRLFRHGIVIPGLVGAGGLAVMLLPLILYRSFNVDWINHVWLTGYYAEHLRLTGLFPIHLDTDIIEGGFPVFYGFLFYSLTGLVSLVTGPDTVIRWGVAIGFTAVFALYYRLAFDLGRDRVWAATVAIAATVSVYGLTNLYIRSATTEVFGVIFASLTLGCALRFLHLTADDQGRVGRGGAGRLLWLNGAFLFYALTIGTHPITAYLTALCLALPMLALYAATGAWRSRINNKAVAAGLIITAVVSAPVLFSTLEYSSSLRLLHGLIHMSDSIDSPLMRLVPGLTDNRVTGGIPLPQISTPFLEAPVNPALGLLLILQAGLTIGLVRRRQGGGWTLAGGVALMLLALGLATGLLLVSLDAGLYTGIPLVEQMVRRLFQPTQYIYRIVSWVTLLCVLGLMAPLLLPSARSALQDGLRQPWMRIATAAVLAVSLTAGIIKTASIVSSRTAFMEQVGARNVPAETLQGGPPPSPLVRTPLARLEERYDTMLADHSHLPGSFYGIRGYTMDGAFPVVSVPADRALVPVSLSRPKLKRGSPPPVPVTCTTACTIRTNIIPSLLLRVVVNGAVLLPQRLVMVDNMLAFDAPPGEYAVTYTPRHGLRLAYNLMAAGMMVWIIASLGLIPWLGRRRDDLAGYAECGSAQGDAGRK